ncbi:MAG: START domain-containing protein [Thalassotalea sp.]|nr:START domain-containing protein [Thalassotalea sp.]
MNYEENNEEIIAPWTQWKKVSSASLFYRQVTDGDLIEVKAQVRLTSSLSGFLLFLLDTDKIPNWLDNAKESKILQSLDNNTHIFTTEFYGFWPIKSREMIIKSRQWQNDDLSIEMQIENALDFDNKKHTILVDVISAHWRITPISTKKIEVIYTFIVDPKGNVPMWLVNPMTLKSTWKTLQNIKEQLPQSKWQSESLANIREMQSNIK